MICLIQSNQFQEVLYLQIQHLFEKPASCLTPETCASTGLDDVDGAVAEPNSLS